MILLKTLCNKMQIHLNHSEVGTYVKVIFFTTQSDKFRSKFTHTRTMSLIIAKNCLFFLNHKDTNINIIILNWKYVYIQQSQFIKPKGNICCEDASSSQWTQLELTMDAKFVFFFSNSWGLPSSIN